MIPMVNLKREYRKLKAQIDRALLEVLEETRFILGPNVTALEKEVADLHNLPDAVAVGNGTDALRLALQACGIGREDEVLTTAFTFVATTEAILASLKENQIAAALFYPIPLHRQEIFSGTPIAEASLPVTERMAQEVISLPMFPDLTEEEIVTICKVVNRALA